MNAVPAPVSSAESRQTHGQPPLLEVDNVAVDFRLGRSIFGSGKVVRAVRGVSFAVGRSETLGLVGESGSGKSTTGRAILRLVEPSGGSVRLDGDDVTAMSPRELRPVRRRIQMVFQDPYSSLNPSRTVGDSISEPLRVHESMTRLERHNRVKELLQTVGLSSRHAERYPYEFSGGQRQRIAIARAIALNPDLVICDEAVSALDVSTQNQIINLLESLKEEIGTAYVFISHDLAVVSHLADRVAVMYAGSIVELGVAAKVYSDPMHPYTKALLSAVPVPDPVAQHQRNRIRLSGDVPDPTVVPAGCAFAARCPHVMDICHNEAPAMVLGDNGVSAACHLYSDLPGSETSRVST